MNCLCWATQQDPDSQNQKKKKKKRSKAKISVLVNTVGNRLLLFDICTGEPFGIDGMVQDPLGENSWQSPWRVLQYSSGLFLTGSG